MRSNRRIYWLSIPLIGIFAFLYYQNTYTEFQPVLLSGESYKNIHGDSIFYQKLKIVFDYNNVQYKIDKEGKPLIKRSLNNDAELIFNYTQKALDTQWLSSHEKK